MVMTLAGKQAFVGQEEEEIYLFLKTKKLQLSVEKHYTPAHGHVVHIIHRHSITMSSYAHTCNI